MHQPKGDPFIEQVKADVQEGIDELDRGEGIPAEEIFAELYRSIDAVEQKRTLAEIDRPQRLG